MFKNYDNIDDSIVIPFISMKLLYDYYTKKPKPLSIAFLLILILYQEKMFVSLAQYLNLEIGV